MSKRKCSVFWLVIGELTEGVLPLQEKNQPVAVLRDSVTIPWTSVGFLHDDQPVMEMAVLDIHHRDRPGPRRSDTLWRRNVLRPAHTNCGSASQNISLASIDWHRAMAISRPKEHVSTGNHAVAGGAFKTSRDAGPQLLCVHLRMAGGNQRNSSDIPHHSLRLWTEANRYVSSAFSALKP